MLGDLGVVREPLGRRLDRAGRIQLAIDLGVAIMRRVECRRRLAADEIVDVAVRVGPPAPADQIGLELAIRGELQG